MEQKLLLLLISLLFIPVTSLAATSMATVPDVQLPLAPVATNPPYDDDVFFDKANTTILGLCTGKVLPAGKMNTAVYDSLAGSYYSLIRMNISEKNYPRAENVISFLSYTLTLMEQYEDYEKEKEKISPVDMGLVSYEDLKIWYDAASGIWEKVSSEYPDATMYKMPPAIEKKEWVSGQFPII